MKYLHSYGNRVIKEFDIAEPKCPKNGVLVRTSLVGVCRSDSAQYQGLEKGVPFGMFGHEGLGEVVEVGPEFESDRNEPINPGDFVSTWSDPAYAEFYPARANELVKVPENHPKFILQPVACAINIYHQTRKFMSLMNIEGDILLLGSGFMGVVIGEAARADGQNLVVVGRANSEFWSDLIEQKFDTTQDLINAELGRFKAIIDISSKAENFKSITSHLAEHEALISYAGTPAKPITTNFFDNCWAAHTFIFPSPRNSDFNDSMAKARDLVISGDLNTERLWTKGYDRFSEFNQAFEDGSDRLPGYVRGYLKF